MSQRTTHAFITPGGHKVILNSYLTGREAQDMKAVLAAAMKLSNEGASLDKVSASLVIESEEKAMKYLLVSFDEDTQNPIETLMSQPASEYEAVVAEINKIQNPTKPQK
jgi:hypothetical protein